MTNAHHTVPNVLAVPASPPGEMSGVEAEYWYGLIDEKVAADHADLTDRTLQNYRQKGLGPRFIRISSRCIRYRRIDLKAWAEARMRTSTSDMGGNHAEAS